MLTPSKVLRGSDSWPMSRAVTVAILSAAQGNHRNTNGSPTGCFVPTIVNTVQKPSLFTPGPAGS